MICSIVWESGKPKRVEVSRETKTISVGKRGELKKMSLPPVANAQYYMEELTDESFCQLCLGIARLT